METANILNPFVVGRYVSDRFFCDRQKETEFLIKQIKNGRNVALISPRRMGKTGLIQHCFNQEQFREYYHTFFVDIYATTSLAEFAYLLGKAIYDELKPKRTVWTERFFQIIRSLRVGFKLDTMTGEPSFDIGLGDIRAPQTTLDEIFEYLEAADKPCLVAIDEFQQIGSYEEKNVEALLRTKIQQCKQTMFIFSGSKQHLMSNLFNSSSKPFYQSAISMGLEPIPMEIYTTFAIRLFEERGKQVEPILVEKVYQQFNGCTWFVQMIMNELFALTAKDECCDTSKLDTAWKNVIQTQEGSYKDLLSRLAPKQKLVLQAIAKEGDARGVTSSAFIKKYNLPSASSVQSALKPLLKTGLVTQEGDAYRVYDYFFADWLANEY
ncbi:ATP-binding protein [Parabacteroides sp. Marseille-P3160]|uniref:AAA family ATPase n=1 Tax=Parabacteroides sp. Marseille-P3160 TaxID=1917887 RepID=UPI0009BA3691|nr:ATP-binding protein [Parabacteroides sp. Marseille-P3160]